MNQRDSWLQLGEGIQTRVVRMWRTHRKRTHGLHGEAELDNGKWIRQRLLGKITAFPLAFMEEFGRAGRHQAIKHSAGWKDTRAGLRLRWGFWEVCGVSGWLPANSAHPWVVLPCAPHLARVPTVQILASRSETKHAPSSVPLDALLCREGSEMRAGDPPDVAFWC